MLRTRAGRWGRWSLGLCLGWLLLCSAALAEALVTVQVRDASGQPADGKVTLVAESGGHSVSCQTARGRCDLPNVPGGLYRASVVPNGTTTSTPPRTVMIPPSGKVSLIISTAASP